MEEKREDRRVRKTKRLLRQGLSQLMMQKKIKDISVRELAELVDINRGTFYIHYRDIYDMVAQIENEMYEDFKRILESHVVPTDEGSLRFLIDFYTYISANHEMVAALLSSNGDIAFLTRIQDMLHVRAMKILGQRYPKQNTRDFEFFYDFVTAGTVQLLNTWLTRETHKTPQEMADLTIRLIKSCATVFKTDAVFK